jgi:hypothetical protein
MNKVTKEKPYKAKRHIKTTCHSSVVEAQEMNNEEKGKQ